MSYCLNPSCPEPRNPGQTQVCRACGSKIILRDRYLSAKKLGKGGFGATFLAGDLSLPGTPPCVIKQLRPTLDDPGVLKMARELFAREAATLGKIGNHPQVPRLLDYFEDNEQFYLIQEFVDGYNLQQEVKLNGSFSEAGVRHFLSDILSILDYIHQQRVIHRDIKPANIIKRNIDKKLVLIDFGAVKNEIDTLAAANVTGGSANTGFAIGTLGFAAPEQLAMRPTYSSDIYAVGVTCIYLLTGKSPKDFVNPSTGELEWEKEVNITETLTRVLHKMTELSLRNRYKSASEVLNALELEPYDDSLRQSLSKQSGSDRASDLGNSAVVRNQETRESPKSVNSKLAEEIRAYHLRKKQKNRGAYVSDPTAIWNNDSPKNNNTNIQNPGQVKGLKLPPKLSSEIILDFYVKGWRDFAQRSLKNITLRQVDLSGSNFHQSQFYQVNFFGSNLSHTDFGRANLSQAILKNANLTNAYLGYGNLQGADLRGANLSGAHLNHANLTNANLCGANLSGAHVNPEQLAVAKVNWATILPNGKRSIW